MRDIGLGLSGGGYRAAVFHLGTLIRLNEAGLLPRLRTVSSVSGGSIVAALLGLRWGRLTFDERGVSPDLDREVVQPLLGFTRRGIDARAVLTSGFIPGLVSRRVQRAYRPLFDDKTVGDLPAGGSGPEVVLTATNLSTGALFRFSARGVGDFRRRPEDTSEGFFQAPGIPLVTAVAASSAFPPVLSPCTVDLSGYASARGAQRTVHLTDGGIYDNLGLEPLAGSAHKVVLASDGGAPFTVKANPARGYLFGLVHVLKVVDLQVRKLRRRQLVASAGEQRRVAYWAIDSTLADYVEPAGPGPEPFEVLPVGGEAVRALAGISTRLAALTESQQHRLVNWGYAGCDAAVRAYVERFPRGRFPYAGGVG